MWWDIIKESKVTSRTTSSLNWDEEMVPDSDETNCREKLISIQRALIDWEPPNSKYKGGSHGSDPYLSTRFWYQDKNNSKPGLGSKSNGQWLLNEKDNGEPHDYCTILVQFDTHRVKNLTEEEACAFLEEIKSFNFDVNGEDRTTDISFMSIQDDDDAWAYPNCNIKYKKHGGFMFYSFTMSAGDKKYSKSTIRELRAFIKQQL